jgi:hypoxanthine-DNA glycosylase
MIKSFKPIVFENSKILILGSIPGVISLQKSEYYGNKQNYFWKIIFSIFEKEFSENYLDKINLLKINNIALWDVIETCQREGSSDSAINNEKANDIKNLSHNYQNIKHIIFNGKTAEKYFKKHIKTVENIKFYTFPSTSGANARMNFEKKIGIWKKMKDF